MAYVYSPNKSFTGVNENIPFNNGKAIVSDESTRLLDKFEKKGFKVEREKEKKKDKKE